MKHLTYTLALVLIMLLTMSAPAIAGIVNPGFETGDFTGWTTDGNVAVVTAGCSTIYPFHCAAPYSGNYMALLTSGAISIAQLDADLGVMIEAVYPNATYGSAIWQTVFVNAGTPLSFAVDFLGNDYTPFNDTAILTAFVIENGSNSTYFLADIATVGNYGTTGWVLYNPFGYSTYTGHYTIGFAVFNQVDNALNSQLLVDSVYFPTPEPGTLVLLGTGVLGLGGLLRRKLNL